MESTEKGIELLDKKIEYLGELKRLTQKEVGLIESNIEDDILRIEAVLEKKSGIMANIDKLDHEYRELVPRKDDRIKDREAQIKELLIELIDMDKEKNHAMKSRYSSEKSGLKGVRQSIKANRAYTYEEQGNIFIDQKK